MLKSIFIIIAVFTFRFSDAQDINLIIQINEELLQGGITDFYVSLDSAGLSKLHSADYIPGNLKIPAEIVDSLKMHSSKSLYLFFRYSTFVNDEQQSAQFSIQLTQYQLAQSYLIWNIYDFRNKKYQKWYQRQKKQEYRNELRYYDSGILLRNK